MVERRSAVRRRLAILLTAAVGAAGLIALIPVRQAQAYNLECCPFARSRAPKLIMAERPGGGTDNSSWFESGVLNGVNAWNDAPTPVYISTELYQDNQDIVFDVATLTSDSQLPTGVCSNSSGGICHQATIHLFEGCTSDRCGMTATSKGTATNYDEFIVAHETGHALGEDHTCVRDVLMSGTPANNPSCPNGNPPYSYWSETNFVGTPQQDDVNGMVKMYGNDSYQYDGGCSDVAGTPSVAVPTPVAQQPQALTTLPPIASLPPTPGMPALVQSLQDQVTAAKGDPAGTAENLANEGLAATGKVVPWYSLPNPGTIQLPLGLGYMSRPC